MALRYKNSDIEKLKNKTIFFDANVLIYIFWPIYNSNKNWPKTYSSIFESLLKNKFNMAINIAVISEVFNRVIRFEHKNFCNRDNNSIEFKAYRNTKDGKDAQKLIYDIIKSKILSCFDLTDKMFSTKEIEELLVLDKLDFNDKIIFSLCKEKNMVLLTNDSDFAQSDIDILSANPKLK